MDEHGYYWAGITVVASHFEIRVRHLSLGDEYGLDGAATLEPVETWCHSDAGMNPFRTARVEDYATALLAGHAAVFIRDSDERCQLKKAYGQAGLEMKFLRRVWQCLQPEPDRAVALIVGFLGEYDDGDVEATAQRLWHRAARILRQPKRCKQLKVLAGELIQSIEMTEKDVIRVLNQE
jgi:hypothetical protein